MRTFICKSLLDVITAGLLLWFWCWQLIISDKQWSQNLKISFAKGSKNTHKYLLKSVYITVIVKYISGIPCHPHAYVDAFFLVVCFDDANWKVLFLLLCTTVKIATGDEISCKVTIKFQIEPFSETRSNVSLKFWKKPCMEPQLMNFWSTSYECLNG